jgi:tRNA threonylcarbamoyladenosine biosynthesis protein TsaB
MQVTFQLIADDGVAHTYNWEAGRTLARDMLLYLRDRLAEHESTFADIDGIGAFRGPGSFTGLRIGLTVLNTLADANGIQIVGETGADWEQRALDRLQRGENDQLVMPEYGGEAHITKPRK